MPAERLPEVGEIVHFYSTNPDHHFNNAGEGPYAALVVHRYPVEQALNLRVFPSRADGYEVTKAMRQDSGMAWWWEVPGDPANPAEA